MPLGARRQPAMPESGLPVFRDAIAGRVPGGHPVARLPLWTAVPQMSPWASIASATRSNPAIFAPVT